jgi:hypothetical protein
VELSEVLQALNGLPEAERQAVVADALKATEGMVFIPNVGPQTDAYYCEANELFYGGQAGGGKSALIVGLSLTTHVRSLLLRRTNKEASKFAGEVEEMLGSRDGFNGQQGQWRLPQGRLIDIGGCQYEDDKQKYKGDPHDLIGFDEVSDFTETQYVFISGWNRSSDPNQRCRIVAAGNPPTRPEGLWVIKRWAAWLDPNHPNPAKPGELRWYTTGEDGKEVEVEGRGPHMIGGEWVHARSRTFIPAKLSDNPDLAATGYGAVLAALPEELRAAYRDGKFEASLKDRDFQVIPTAWILAAEERWKADGYKEFQMTAMAYDPAGGGRDSAELACRHGGWYAPLISVQGAATADGSAAAASIVKHRRDNAPVVVDVGGGYGGAVCLRLKDNNIPYLSYNGADGTTAKTVDGQLGFFNKRAETYWRLREALDPGQEGGSCIALPPDPELRAELAAHYWWLTPRGIQLCSKDDVREIIGRSPGKSDAVTMALSRGDQAIRRTQGYMGREPRVNMGHESVRRRMHSARR